MKFSLRLNNDLPVKDYITMAQAAESAGFDQFWVSNDLFLRSAAVILTAVAAATERIEIGTCILNPYTINPAEIAMFAATLDEFSGGRFNLGLASGAKDFLKWIGIDPVKPRTTLVETINAINDLLNGNSHLHEGHFIRWTDEAYMRFQPQRKVPIYIGAMSPNMLRSIGAVADGGLPLLFPPEHYQTVMPYIQEGARDAERDMDAVDVAACVWASVDEDAEAAKDALREKVAYYGRAMSPLILKQLDLSRDDFTEIENLVMVEKDMAAAKRLVTDKMLKIGIVGTTHDLIDRLEILAEMGVKHMSFGPPLGPNPLKAVQQIGNDVIPHFRSK
ncbi:MAG: LLM class flavin-dependent oxidoreductase [Anaerolineae bacterium]|nr:LLM class flavin-dependent oxidoreductase [Anaerolineae bacterium]